MFNIFGKVGLVTGASGGIGSAIVKELIKNGAKGIAILDINEEAGLTVVNKLNQEFGKNKTIFIKTDVSSKNQFEDAFKTTINTFKHLDIVVNNAAIVLDSDWEREVAVNFTGTVNGTILAFEKYLPKYKSGEESVIVNVASMAGIFAYPGTPIYCGTKAGVIGLTRNLGYEGHYERTKIKVVSICPGFTDTSIVEFTENQTLGSAYMNMHIGALSVGRRQPPTAVAKGAIYIMKEANSGSVWISTEDKPAYEIKFLDEEECRK